MPNYPLEHCLIDDPDVCSVCIEKNQGVYYKVIPGARACPRHGGNTQLESLRKKAANQYRLQLWQQRVNEFTESDYAKSLRSEIGILKMTLEQFIVQAETPQQLLIFAPKIADLVTRIEKVVMSCDRLERNMGQSMDRSTAMKLAADIVDLISRHVNDAETIDAISSGIIDLLKDL